MKANQLIETLRNFHEEPVYILMGFNRYKIHHRNILFDEQYKCILITADADDVENPPE